MRHSTLPGCEPNSASTLPDQPSVLVGRKHHFLVRWSHWLNVPILLGLILSGISIYWASPIYQHKPDPNTGNSDVAADRAYVAVQDSVTHRASVVVLNVENSALVFRAAHYFLQLGPWRLRLPAWASPGALAVTHAELGDGRFLFKLDIVHPRLGRLICQTAAFEEAQP